MSRARRVPEAIDDGVIRIRRPNLGDAPAVYRAVEASRPELSRWMHWCIPEYSIADAEAWIMAAAIAWPHGEACPFLVETKKGGQLLGSCGLQQVDAPHSVYQLGYWIRTDQTGRQFARRAAALAARFAVEHLGCERIEILVATTNLPSLAVVASLGAREEGVLVSRLWAGSAREDARLFALLPGTLPDFA